MFLSLASVALGITLALAYERFSLRSQARFASRPGSLGGLVFAAEFVLRLTVVGAVLAAAHLWTSLDIVIVAISFVAVFAGLHGLELYRYATGRGGFGAPGGSPDSTRRAGVERDYRCDPSAGGSC